jgi:hypothetical protein
MFFRWHTTACGGAAYGASLDLEKVYLAAIVNPNTRSTESAWRMFMLTQIRSFSAAAVLAITIAVPAVAATIPFTFTVSGGAALLGPPAPDNPVGVMLFASAEFDPFGPAADYSESGTITFTFWPSGDFAQRPSRTTSLRLSTQAQTPSPERTPICLDHPRRLGRPLLAR